MEATKVSSLIRRIHDEQNAAYTRRANKLKELHNALRAANGNLAAAFQTFAHTQFVQNASAFGQEVLDHVADAEEAREKNRAQIGDMTAKVDGIDRDLAALAKALEGAREQALEKLRVDETFLGLEKALDQACLLLQADKAEYERLLAEVSEKLPKYLDDEIFQYLLKVHFGTGVYSGKGWVVRADGALARKSQFLVNKDNFLILQGVKAEAEARLVELTQGQASALHAYETYQAEVLNSEELRALHKAIDLRESERELAHETLSACLEEESKFAVATDGLSREATGLINRLLQQQNPQSLASFAAETPSAEDDAALTVIQEQLGIIRKLTIEMDDAKARLQSTEVALKKAKELLRTVDRDPHFSGGHYRYTSESDVKQVLDQFMQGAGGTQELMNGLKLQRAYVHKPSPPAVESPKGAFSSSGNLAGGSFKTTNSF